MPQPDPPLPHKRVKTHLNFDMNNNNGTIRPYNPRFDLSNDVLDHIISFLPIKHAVRIGILNSALKNSWLYNRNLCFGRDLAMHYRRDEIIDIVNRVFSLHRGSVIRCFQLCIDPLGLDSTIESWTRILITKGVEELDFDFSEGSVSFKLSTHFINSVIVTLKVFKLSYCRVFDFPNKFNFLRILTLRKVLITKKSIASVLNNCLNLEVLELAHCRTTDELKIFTEDLKKFKVLKVGECLNLSEIHIHSPTLCSFHYHGFARRIYFTNTTSQLKDTMISFISQEDFVPDYHTRDLVLNLDCVEVLTINSTFLEGISSHFVDGEIIEVQFNLSNVKELQVFMETGSYCNPYDIVSFVDKCPKVEKLFIDLDQFNFECGHYWEIHLKEKFMKSIKYFHHLKLIKVESFNFQEDVLELVSFFLKGALFLETLALVTPRDRPATIYEQDAKNYEQFLNCWRVSPIARIFISDHTNDMTFTYPKHAKSWY